MAYVSRVYIGGKLASSGSVETAFAKPRMDGEQRDRAYSQTRELRRTVAATNADRERARVLMGDTEETDDLDT